MIWYNNQRSLEARFRCQPDFITVVIVVVEPSTDGPSMLMREQLQPHVALMLLISSATVRQTRNSCQRPQAKTIVAWPCLPSPYTAKFFLLYGAVESRCISVKEWTDPSLSFLLLLAYNKSRCAATTAQASVGVPNDAWA